MLDPGAAYVNIVDVFPNTVGVNASGPGATDGFEYVANFVNDNNLGPFQMILNRAGMTPNGVVESDSASQIREALQRISVAPGVEVGWHRAVDPATAGFRLLLLYGQGVLITNYPELDAANYVGDGNNATVAAEGGGYYRADDAAGTIPNIAGIYIIMPETRGMSPRGLDLAATIDPDGASRVLGSPQQDAMQGHYHEPLAGGGDFITTNSVSVVATGAGAIWGSEATTGSPVDDGTNGVPRTAPESRGANYADIMAVGY